MKTSAVPTGRGWLVAAAAALVALGLAGGRWLWRGPAAPEWRGMLLGGPEIAMAPRISPDGHTLAFQAMAGNNTQVAVMRPETGNWAVLTHRNDRGSVIEISWSPDGSRIYYDRFNGAPSGIFSIPVVGGEEHLILEEANCPQALPDGSLLLVRIASGGGYQLFRFWPDTGQFRNFPVDVVPVGVPISKVRVFPDGREAAVVGTLMGQGQSRGRHLYIVNLESGAVRRLNERFQDEGAGALAITRDGRSVLVVVPAGNLFRVVAIPRDGRASVRTLLTLTADVGAFDVGADGSIYIDQTERPVNIVRFSRSGGHAQTVAALRGDLNQIAALLPLPDGRIVSQQMVGGHSRLVLVEAGKEPVPLVNTEEQTSAPVALAGREVVFLIGPESHREIAFASYTNGRIIRRVSFAKGPVSAIAATPDGKMLYCAGTGGIWSISSAGGEPARVHDGSSVAADPGGDFLVVQVIESNKVRLFRVPLHGGVEQEIPLHGTVRLADIAIDDAIAGDGRLLASLGNEDSWFNPPGLVDLKTGLVQRIPVDPLGDYLSLNWSPDGEAVAAVLGLRSMLWRFQADGVSTPN